MGAPNVRLRCPACGQELRAVLAPSPSTQWFPCPHCRVPVPVVVPRDPPPLFSWEVYPGLYPMLPRPHRPRWRARGLTVVALFLVVGLAIAFAGLLAFYAVAANQPASYDVSGAVDLGGAGGGAPAAHATVVLTEDNGQKLVTYTDLYGSFAFPGVPAGGIVLNVSYPGYAPVEVDTFASPVYNAGTQGILVTLAPGSVGSGSTVSLTPFPNLETLLASVGGAVVLFGIVAVVALLAGVGTARADRPALGIVGGSAAVVSPLVLFLLGLSPVFPDLLAATAIPSAVGAFAVGLRAIELAQTGETLGPE